MKRFILFFAVAATVTATPVLAVNKHLCESLRPTMIQIVNARDAGASSGELYHMAQEAAITGAPNVPQMQFIARSMVSMALAQPSISAENITADFVKRCSTYRGNVIP